ncbi:MAG: metallophosphoesterase [Spirochaetales bacterium]|nr:metallophosphoesterase [Spirochaetales bacterium]
MHYWRIFCINVIIVILAGCTLPGNLDEEEKNYDMGNISIWYSPVSPEPGQVIMVYALGIDDPLGFFQYEWDLGDTYTSSEYVVYHAYSSEGIYSVTLTVTENNGNIYTTVRNISVSNNHGFSFIAYGDSRSDPEEHQRIVNAFTLENPELVFNSGDLWDGYTSFEWLSHYLQNPVTDALLEHNKVCIARGNHETEVEIFYTYPSIVKDNKIEYAFVQNNCFFICMGLDPGENNSWLEQQLQSREAQNAAWRIIFCHKPIYSAGSSHGADGFVSSGSSVSNFRLLCDTYKVTWVFAGHDHHYERTHYIYNGNIVSTKTTIPAGTPGTFYIVTGGGGAPLYAAGSDWWTNISLVEHHYCLINAFDDHCELIVKKTDGSVIDLATVYK